MHVTNNIAIYMRQIVKLLIVHFRHTDPSKLYDVNQHVTYLGWGLCTKRIIYYSMADRRGNIALQRIFHTTQTIFVLRLMYSSVFLYRDLFVQCINLIVSFVISSSLLCCMHDMKKKTSTDDPSQDRSSSLSLLCRIR